MIIDIKKILVEGKAYTIDAGRESFTVTGVRKKDVISIRITGKYSHVFGLGERFDTLDQAGLTRSVRVQEKFTQQGSLTYMPVPFFFTDTGTGIYIDTLRIAKISFGTDIDIELPYGEFEKLPDFHYFTGTPAEILRGMSDLLGVSPLPPRWAFGPWISGNRWNSREIVESQMEISLKEHFPASVLVIEAWSDESTFYLWNDAGYSETSGGEPLGMNDLSYPAGAKWPSPQDMITKLHDHGIRLILWQVPVLKKLEPGRTCLQHDRDISYALEHGYVVTNADGTPYVIPAGHWFSGSFVPDFTLPEAAHWWFSKRQYLTEMGVDGYKTDGGEFIYDESVRFSDGRTGKEMINEYPCLYTHAYAANNGPDQVLFSRAGYTRSRSTPIHWAGDQMSTWEEMQHCLTAGLSAGLAGITYWSFDIAGFAGPMPDPELYARSVQWSVFAPVMQWHSEPIGGQFAELMASQEKVNDRSPWNIAAYYDRPELVDQLRFHFALRMNLLPSIYSYAIESGKTGLPMMRPLMLDYPQDAHAYGVADEYLFGNLLTAPVLTAGKMERSVYIPEGAWTNLWTGETVFGPCEMPFLTGGERIPVFLRSGKALLLDLDQGREPGVWLKNGEAGLLPLEDTLYLGLAGTRGADAFYTDTDRILSVQWDEEQITFKITGASQEPGTSLPVEKTSRMLLKDMEAVRQSTLGLAIYKISL